MAREYRVVYAPDFAGKDNSSVAEKRCNEMAAEGWRLATATVEKQAGNTARLLMFFEREAAT